MHSITCPVLLALGEYDFIATPNAWTDANRPSDTTTEIFDRSGHTPFVEQPEEFVAAVDRWLAAKF
jgi:proline iminopeptidase